VAMFFLEFVGENFLFVKIRRQFYCTAQIVSERRFSGLTGFPIPGHDVQLVPDDFFQSGMSRPRFLFRERKHFVVQINCQCRTHASKLTFRQDFSKIVRFNGIAMPFYFKRKESVAKAVRRLCCERVDEALKCLRRENHFDGVHDVRREIKKLRAILRLVRDEIGKKVYRRNTDILREAAECLTAMRDAQVKLNALEELARHFRRQLRAKSFPEIKNALRQNCRAEERKLLKNDSIRAVKKILQKFEKRVGDLQIESNGWPAIGSGLRKIYGRGREAFKAAHGEPSPENFHEWRKRVKDLWIHLRLLCPANPEKLRMMTDELESLGNFLGDDHDLFLLTEFLTGKNFGCDETLALEKLICRRQKELRTAALKTGVKFYSKAPKQFCARIEDYWKRWRGEK
jgi:CHAD domain-containing protein